MIRAAATLAFVLACVNVFLDATGRKSSETLFVAILVLVAFCVGATSKPRS